MGAMVSSEEEGEVGETLQSGDTQLGDSNLEKVESGNLEVGLDAVLPSDSPDSTTYQVTFNIYIITWFDFNNLIDKITRFDWILKS